MVGEETKNSAEDHNGEMALIQMNKANWSLAVELACQIQACNWQRVEALLTSVPGGETLLAHMVAAEQTALHLAVEFNADPMIIQGLIKVMDMNEAKKPDKKGNTPLHLCCRYSAHFQMLGLLVEAWPDAVSHQNRRGHTPLDNLFMRDVDATSVMLNACPEAIDRVDRDGQTLLHRALRHGATPELIQSIPPMGSFRIRMQDLMARLTREQWMAKDNEGRTPLHYAIYWSSSVDVVRELVHAAYELIHMKDLKGKTLMDHLLSFYAPEFSSNHIQIGWNNSLYNVVDLVRAFFVNGPHQDKTRSVELNLHSALYTKDCPMAIIECLVVAAPEQADEFETGNIPLHLAAQVQDFDESHSQSYVKVIMELLIGFPEDMRAPNPDGLLPLNLMISAGADVHGIVEYRNLLKCIRRRFVT